MPIESDAPITQPATPQFVYDKWWINDFHPVAPDPTQPINAHAEMTRMGVVEGKPVLSVEHSVSFDLADILNLPAEDDAIVGAVLSNAAAIVAASPNKSSALVEIIAQSLGGIAKRRGIIS